MLQLFSPLLDCSFRSKVEVDNGSTAYIHWPCYHCDILNGNFAHQNILKQLETVSKRIYSVSCKVYEELFLWRMKQQRSLSGGDKPDSLDGLQHWYWASFVLIGLNAFVQGHCSYVMARRVTRAKENENWKPGHSLRTIFVRNMPLQLNKNIILNVASIKSTLLDTIEKGGRNFLCPSSSNPENSTLILRKCTCICVTVKWIGRSSSFAMERRYLLVFLVGVHGVSDSLLASSHSKIHRFSYLIDEWFVSQADCLQIELVFGHKLLILELTFLNFPSNLDKMVV